MRAAADGVISSQGLNGDGGNTIIIQHPNGYESVYAHLSEFLLPAGSTVKKGEIIGLSGGAKGATGAGNSSGPHLHFQIDKGKGAANAVNPAPLLGLATSTGTYQNKDSILTQLKKLAIGGPALAILSANGGNNPVTNSIPGSGTAKDIVGGFTSTSNLIGFISNPANLKRIGMGAIGVSIIALSVVKLVNDSPVTGTLKDAAGKVALAA